MEGIITNHLRRERQKIFLHLLWFSVLIPACSFERVAEPLFGLILPCFHLFFGTLPLLFDILLWLSIHLYILPAVDQCDQWLLKTAKSGEFLLFKLSCTGQMQVASGWGKSIFSAPEIIINFYLSPPKMSFLLTPRHIELAKMYCQKYHEGQFRKETNQPYCTHPFAVAETLDRFGYSDPITQCVALLHDTVEDTPLCMDEIHEIFGYEISNGVYILSRNKGKMKDGQKLSRDEYLQRLFWARKKYRRVKIADVIDNTKDLESLSDESRTKKMRDAREVYIPWGLEIAPLMVGELIQNVENFERKMGRQGGS